MRSFWWVNHKQTFTQEIGGNYIWSPFKKSDGGRNEFYENMRKVRVGDIIFSFANASIQGVGMCIVPAVVAPKPIDYGSAGETWNDEGWKVGVNFKQIDNPIRPKEHMSSFAPVLPSKYSPIRADGSGNQGAYLAAIPLDMAKVVISLLDDQYSNINWDTTTSKDLDQAEIEIEKLIENRTDIGEVEKLQLVNSRRGQGRYRKNLEGFEEKCRVTGLSNLKHLRASHIKPWRSSTSFEKLDGNNGLLLSPHIDHLFDKGYISFSDTGELLVSKDLDDDTLTRWNIDVSLNNGNFRPEQIVYLKFHRESVFKT